MQFQTRFRGRFALSPGRWSIAKNVQIPPSSGRATGLLPLWCVLPYCCAAVVDWSVRTAPLLLYCCGGGFVGGWVVGGGCLVGGGSLAIHEMAGGRKTTNLTRVFYRAAGPQDSGTNQMLLAYRHTAVHTAALLYCCGGLVGGWWGCTWVGRTCGVVRGCAFVPVGDGPVITFFIRTTLISIQNSLH